jgi:predicted DNA-binding protein
VPVKRRYSFFISDDLYEGLKALKKREGVPEAESIRRALGEYLRKKRIAVHEKSERRRAVTRQRP